ncbi:MAG: sigma-70 family RNA polymerase sigma factor [Acidimicrobiales bacterium]|nr:sigma-70 family RNA polymerase sigma factor [Acidimicrobiales bacterium]
MRGRDMHADMALPRVGEPAFGRFGMDIGGQVAASDASPDGAGAVDPAVPGGFDDLYRANYESLVRLGFLLTLSEEVARDLVHDVFVRVYGRWDSLEDPVPYLRRCVVNASRSWHRRRRLERSEVQARTRAATHAEVVAFDADELFDVLSTLPSRQRAAIVLRFYEQMSDGEIAALLHCRPGTVASLVHRGCARLRSAMADPGEAS